MAQQGTTIENRLAGGRLFYRALPADAPGALLVLEFSLRPLWWAGPVHVHPLQEERATVVSGLLGATVAGRGLVCREGESLRIPPGTPHTLWNAGLRRLHVVNEFRPALRTDEFFAVMWTLGRPTVRAIPRQLALLASGFPSEIRWTGSVLRSAALLAAALAGIGLAAHRFGRAATKPATIRARPIVKNVQSYSSGF